MDLPIQLTFFKKLELYQELQRLDRQQNENPASVWHLERRILEWTVSNHHHLGTPLTLRATLDNILPETKEDQGLVIAAMKNLIERAYAKEDYGNDGDGIRVVFLREGRLIGEVITDCDSTNWLRRNQYFLLYFCVWTLVIAAVVAALSAILGALTNVFGFFHWFSFGGFHWHHYRSYGS